MTFLFPDRIRHVFITLVPIKLRYLIQCRPVEYIVACEYHLLRHHIIIHFFSLSFFTSSGSSRWDSARRGHHAPVVRTVFGNVPHIQPVHVHLLPLAVGGPVRCL